MKQQTRDLSQKVQALLNKPTQQLMLSRIVNNPDFDKFLNGDTPVRVYTPRKELFQAIVRVDKSSAPKFRLEPRGIVPAEVNQGSVLLLAFPSGNTQLIAQCIVDSLSLLVIGIKPIDPRVDPRILTLLETKLVHISAEIHSKIAAGNVQIHRILELSDSKTEAECHSCQDRLIATDVTENSVHQSPEVLPLAGDFTLATMTDISPGGCRLQFRKNTPFNLTDSSQLILVEFSLPMLTERKASLFALIRQKRRHRESLVLHCMFLEKLPDGFLDV